jgi:hypothetical protein
MTKLTKVQKLRLKINALVDQITEIQDSCDHPNATKKGCSNTGNYDPSCDSYWYDCRCPDCDKFWQEDQ